MGTNLQPPALRVDLWLRHVCLVKHRAQATEACQGGHVKINGRRAKPSSTIREGDVVEMTAGRVGRFVVLAVPPKPVSKQMGREMYRDESPPPEPRQERLTPAVPGAERDRGAGRPTKRERREIERFRRG